MFLRPALLAKLLSCGVVERTKQRILFCIFEALQNWPNNKVETYNFFIFSCNEKLRINYTAVPCPR